MDDSSEASSTMEGVNEFLDFFETFVVVSDVLRNWKLVKQDFVT